MAPTPPVVLTIAGFDPSSGAGITADIKTIAAHECYGVSCITAITVQSTQGVKRVVPEDPGTVVDTLSELVSDVEVAAVHVGMLGTGEVALAVAQFLKHAGLPHVVLDPVLKSSSGADLLDSAGLRTLMEMLIPLAEVVTPNRLEAAALTGLPVGTLEETGRAAERLHVIGAANVVITGGDLDRATDYLSFATPGGHEVEVFKAERIRSSSTHGTGCAFATSLACHLAQGRAMPEAVLLSKAYVAAAIANATPLGKGTGPLHHLFRMNRQRRVSGAAIVEGDSTHSRK